MSRLGMLASTTALALAAVVASVSTASATVIFNISGQFQNGAITNDPSGFNDIISGITSVTLQNYESVSLISGGGSTVVARNANKAVVAAAGITTQSFYGSSSSSFSIPVDTNNGMVPFTITLGNAIFGFSAFSPSNYQFVSYDSTNNITGVLKEDFTGYVISDGGAGFAGSTDSISIQCQDTGAASCSFQIFVPSADAVPEPVSMAVLGFGIAGLAAVRRRRAI